MLRLVLASAFLFSACTPALVVKAQSGDLDALRALLAKNPPQADKDEALLESVSAGRDDAAGLLLDHGASVEAKNESKVSALALAVIKGEPVLVKLLLERKARPETSYDALAAAPADTLELFLEHGLDPNFKDSKDATPLARAACSGRADLVKFWLSHGAEPEKSGKACLREHFDPESVQMVCEMTATAADCAKSKGYTEITALLNAARK